MTDAILLVACVVLAGAVVALGVAVRRLGSQLADLERGLVTGASAPSSTTVTADAHSSTTVTAGAPSPTGGSLVEEVAQRPSRDHRDEAGAGEYVITRLGDGRDEPVPTIEARLFADLVLRESVVKAASFTYGVRRGLSPANRHRIWFEMRREVKRARKERKVEQREAIRAWRARQRAAVRDRSREEDAA